MNNIRPLVISLLAAMPLLACSQPSAPVAQPSTPSASSQADDAPKSFIGREVDKALDEARKELATENISIGGDGFNLSVNGKQVVRKTSSDLPKAEITPQGDLLIAGKAVDIDAGQRQQLLAYRGRIIGIAESGMLIGGKGADLAGEALTGVAGAIFGGDSGRKEYEQRMEARGKQIETEALKLCGQLPGLLASQQALATSLPAFKPYATMTQADIDDCGKGKGKGVSITSNDGQQGQAAIRDNIRRSIRTAVQGASAAAGASSSASVDGVRFLVPAGSLAVDSSSGASTLDAGGDLKVRLQGNEMWINGVRYPRPAKGSEVDLLTAGTVKVDGKAVTAN